MALCAVCQCPCRWRCRGCGARLCAAHKPTGSYCPKCRSKRSTSPPRAVPALLTNAPAPPSLASLPLLDQLQQLTSMRKQLVQKQVRERAYLDRRAARGTHAPTDDAYEADQLLEDRLLEALNLLEQYLHGGSPLGASPTSARSTSFLFADPDHHAKLQPEERESP